MRATLEFELPKEQEAYEAAMDGAKWKAFAHELRKEFERMSDTSETVRYGIIFSIMNGLEVDHGIKITKPR